MSKTILSVPDISCEHCDKTITGALKGQPGVNSVKVDVPTKTVKLDHDESVLPLDKVSAILEDEGYPVASSSPA